MSIWYKSIKTWDNKIADEVLNGWNVKQRKLKIKKIINRINGKIT
jgi:hypothetical protein